MAPYLLASLEVSAAFYSAEHEGRNWRHLCSSVQVPWGCMTVGAKLLVDHLGQRIDALADRVPFIRIHRL